MKHVKLPVTMNVGFEKAILGAVPMLAPALIRALWNALVQQCIAQDDA